MKEGFRPIKNIAPIGIMGRAVFYLRFIFDLQNYTIYCSLRKYLKDKKGTVLDVGCGDSAYRYALNNSCSYMGIDITNHADFDYDSKDIIYFEGKKIPLETSSIDSIICTEVMEHHEKPSELAAEMLRVLKKNGTCFITIPWSARYHYIPYDYYRYTPASINKIFAGFSSVEIESRGTDITSICSKIIVLCARNIMPVNFFKWLILPVTLIVFTPVMLLAAAMGHASLLFKAGSKDDPLGYTVYVRK